MKDKKPNLAQRAPLETITTTQPFELITVDYLHLDQCKGKYEYFLVIWTNLQSLHRHFRQKTNWEDLQPIHYLTSTF